MRYLKGNEIRKMWLDFWSTKGHKIEESASLVPSEDKTLLWMNAGVSALKKYFDGRVVPQNPRIVNAQKCIRTNDIENVGHTARHHTFFEMLGNFSIGDYFRNEAMEWGLEVLTSEKYFGLPLDKIYITVYENDDETYNKWISLGVEESHLIRSKENFWEIGEGPCGPDTELYFDRGEEFGDFTPEAIRLDIENDRYIELYNIVFSQYNSKPGVKREDYKELPHKNIDTGMGLERITSVIQGAKTNFETDLFMPIMDKISEISGIKYEGQMSFKVIADHIRTVTFALSDGALFSNEGRGYVLRRLLRRAVKHGINLGINRLFFTELVDVVVDNMKEYYSYLVERKEMVKKLILIEEKKFHETINQGVALLKTMLKETDKVLPGDKAFLMYDTYGFPIELTLEYAIEESKEVDLEGFKEEMQKQKERARSARNSAESFKTQNEAFLNFKDKSIFVGYEKLEAKAKVIKVFDMGFVTDVTPFYAECGGQVGDKGVVRVNGEEIEIIDTKKLPNSQALHIIEDGNIKEGDEVELIVDEEERKLTMYNHSATHIMFKELRDLLGSHVSQQGSEVSSKMLRFDFNHFEPLKDEQILSLEKAVNEDINKAYKGETKVYPIEEASKLGAIAEFGEKYESEVRVVNLGVTLDFCGGTHVSNTKDIERFMVLSVQSIGSGIYRLQGLTNKGIDSLDSYMSGYNHDLENLINKANSIKEEAKKEGFEIEFNYQINKNYIGSYQDIINKRIEVKNLQEKVKELEKKVSKLKDEKASSSFSSYDYLINGNVAFGIVENVPSNILKNLVDDLALKVDGNLVFVADKLEDKVIFMCKTNKYDAGALVKKAAMMLGGNGGGRKDFAQAGGKDVTKVDEVMAQLKGELL